MARVIGLKVCTSLAKRAIQFGSRCAKMLTPNANGADVITD